MCFVLKTSNLVLAMNVLKTCVRTPATHCCSCPQLPNGTYVKMIASHSYSPSKMGSITLRIFKRCLCTTVFSVGLKVLQKDQVKGQPKVELSTTDTHLASYQQTCSSLLSKCIHVQILCEKPNKCLNECVESWKQFWGHSSPVVAHITAPNQKRKIFISRAVVWYVHV